MSFVGQGLRASQGSRALQIVAVAYVCWPMLDLSQLYGLGASEAGACMVAVSA